jgi:glycosyltransferase involved in cell wall biosynthesis/peptidoglycan/xylan/chitin deacetylase (PgdA/CDA1 family)
MRLLFISNDFPYPGDPTRGIFNLHLVRALIRKHEVRVIAPRTWIEAIHVQRSRTNVLHSDSRAQLAGIHVEYPTFYYPPKVFRNAYGFFLWHSLKSAIGRVLHSFSPDAIIAYWAHPDGAVAVRLAKMIGVPAVVIVGGSDVLLLTKNRRRRMQIQKVLQNAHAIVAVSRDLKNKIVELGVDGSKVHVWHQGVDQTVFFPGNREASRRRLGVPVAGRKLLWVGRMVPVKGLEVLVQACADLRKRGCDFHLYLAGDGPLRSRLESEVATLGLADSITFTGSVRQEQLAEWYRAVDATVMASHSEGIPNVLRESLACGTPFVATRVGGIPEIANGQAAELVPAGDPVALGNAIDQLLARPASTEPHSTLPSWQQAAESFMRIVEPLALASQNPDQPWWIGESTAASPAGAGRNLWRQLARRALARLLPVRMIIRGPAASNSVYLTFDDGPHPKHTSELLDVLQAYGIKATFFVIGRLVERYPQLVYRIQEEGHLVANHSFYHPNPKSVPASFLLNGIERTDKALTEMLGTKDSFYRPPHGKLTTWKLLRLWMAKRKIVLWNVDPKDYACRSSEELLAWFQQHPLSGGDVILLHDRLPHASAVIPHLAAAAKERGLSFVTIDHYFK